MWDAIVVGGGHNGLAAAAYLARGRRRTLVLERRAVLGGACVTEERWPGARVSRAAYVAGLLRPAVLRELGLAARGLRLLPRDPASFTPVADGGGLLLGSDPASNRESIARFSRADAARYPDYEAFLDRVARTLEPLLDRPPPDPGRLRLADLPGLARAARGAFGLGRDSARALSLFLAPARTTLESWFESEPLRATLATDAVIGAWAAPSTPGTGYVLFHHVMGETGGRRGVWAYVEGGMGRLPELLAEVAVEAGAEIRRESPVARICVEAGRARGVELEDGTFLESRVVLSSADPKRTFLDLVGPGPLPPDFVRSVETIDFRSPVVKINAVLDRLPAFRGMTQSGAGPEHRGTTHVGAVDLDALERSFHQAEAGALPERPMVELTLPSAVDPTLAPEGRFVASMFVQYAPQLEASAWGELRDAFADRAFAMLDEAAPGFSASVVEREVLAPPDLERIFGLTGGNIFHGAMGLDRLAFLRPAPGWSRYATPVAGLYLCGAGAHPGGGVMAACGRNAAREVLRTALS